MRAEGPEPSEIRLEICGGSQADRIEAGLLKGHLVHSGSATLPGYYHGHCKSAQATSRATDWKIHMSSMQVILVGKKKKKKRSKNTITIQ